MDELQQFKQTFFQECEELLGDLEGNLMSMESGDFDVETLHAAFRAIHSIKGGAGAFGFERLVNFAHTFETVLDLMREDKVPADEDNVAIMLRSGDIITDLVKAAQDDEDLEAGYETETAKELAVLAQAGGAEVEGVSDSGDAGGDLDDEIDGLDFEPVPVSVDEDDGEEAAPAPAAEPAAEGGADLSNPMESFKIRFVPSTEMLQRANEPLLLVRELKATGNLRVTCDMETLPQLSDMDASSAYLAWDFELDTRQGREAIDDIFEFVEGDCDLTITNLSEQAAPAQEEVAAPEPKPAATPEPEPEPTPVPAAAKEPKEEKKAETPPPAAAKPKAAAAPKKEAGGAPAKKAAPAASAIRVDVDKVDKLVNMVGELVITQAMLDMQSGMIPSDEYPELISGLEELAQHTRELQDSVMAIRAQPVKSVFARMPRLVREVAAKVNKKVTLKTVGENTEIDKTVIEQLGDPLTHMIRNAIDHGLELPEEREAAGKSKEGTIVLSAEHRGGRILIEIKDDGRGINREKVLAKAIERGVVQEGAQLADEEIDNLVFQPGFSTADEVTDLSGRGVGMDVVVRNIQNLGGRVNIRSTPGEGSTFSLTLPLTLAVLDGMVVRVGTETYVLPLANIIESLRPLEQDIHSVMGEGDVLKIRGEYIQLVYLHRHFRIPDGIADPSKGLVVIVETEGGAMVGLVVDEIVGQQQVVIKSLEENFGAIKGVAGATILGTGKVALILDVAGLKAMSDKERKGRKPKEIPTAAPPAIESSAPGA